MGEGGEDLRQLWPRRRFIAAVAATSLVAAAGATPGDEAAGQDVADRLSQDRGEQLDHLPIHGSPHLLATVLPTSHPSTAWTRSDARVIHFHLPRDERERLLLPLP